MPLTLLIALLSGVLLGTLGVAATLTGIGIVGVLALAPLLFALRQDEHVAVTIIAINLLIDWYQLVDATQLLRLPVHISVVSTFIAVLLIALMYFGRSSERPWFSVPYLPLWVILLLFAAYPMLEGQSAAAVKYYVGVFVNAVLMYTIGIQIGGDGDRFRRLLIMLAGFGAAVALHTIVYMKTGTFFLATHALNDYLQTKGDFALGNSGSRAGSFLFNPDMNGAFLALMALIPVGLLSGSRSGLAKLVYLLEAVLILLALFFTYSTAAWIAVATGFTVFVVFVSRGRQRFLVVGTICVICAAMAIALQTELQSFIRHSSDPNELVLREGGWLTAIRVTMAHPLTGIGLDPGAYEHLSAAYRVPEEYVALGHPHEAYLELAALAGLPVLIAFVALVGSGLRLAMHSYRAAAGRYRGMIGGASVALLVLSVNSLAINGWTIAPVVAIAFLILGAISSPGWIEASSSVAMVETSALPPGDANRDDAPLGDVPL